MPVEIGPVVTTLATGVASVGAVGAAKLGVQTLLRSYDYLRHQLGMSPVAAMREAREQAEREHAQSEMFSRNSRHGR